MLDVLYYCSMAFLTLAEFQRASGLSDRAVLGLLGSPGLETGRNEQGVLTLNVDTASVLKAREIVMEEDRARLLDQASEIRLQYGELLRSTVEEVVEEALRRLKEHPPAVSTE